jgi:hypothetical protein
LKGKLCLSPVLPVRVTHAGVSSCPVTMSTFSRRGIPSARIFDRLLPISRHREILGEHTSENCRQHLRVFTTRSVVREAFVAVRS